MFPPRLRRGTHHPDAPPSPRSASESVRADTLRALPENAATPATTEQEGTGTSALSLQTAQRDGIRPRSCRGRRGAAYFLRA